MLSVLDHSTVLPTSEPLRRLLNSLDKHHLIQIVLWWVHQAQHSPSPHLLAPQLSRRASRRGVARSNNFDYTHSQDHERVSVLSYLDLHEERRARSYTELTTLWLESMSEAKIPRARGVDRILNVDWPSGLTYAMVATLSFELIRANPVKKVWHTFRFDFGDDNAGESLCELGKDLVETHTSLTSSSLSTFRATSSTASPDTSQPLSTLFGRTSTLLLACIVPR